MADLERLTQHREALLLAEVAAWLHNIGKLEPNFIGGAPKELSIEGYRFKRFVAPDLSQVSDTTLRSLLEQEIDEDAFKQQIASWIRQQGILSCEKAVVTLHEFIGRRGPLYFADQPKREEVLAQQQRTKIEAYAEQRIQEKESEWREKFPGGWKQLIERKRGEYIQQRKDELKRNLEQICQSERIAAGRRENLWRQLQLKIPEVGISWPLADLLTLFWEDFFEKPRNNQYNPGDDNDPDYHRIYLLSHVFPSLDHLLPALLILAHGEVSGQEKSGYTPDGRYRQRDEEESDDKRENLQKYNLGDLRLSTAFGYEAIATVDWPDWPKNRRRIVKVVPSVWQDPLAHRTVLVERLQALGTGVADARLPFNEISLLDYVQSIAALFKSAIAQAILIGRIPTPADMRWRLLSVRLDAWDFLSHARQVSDLIARKRLLDEAYQVITHLLEVELPIGSKVYSDEHGLVFVIPELPGYPQEQLRDEIASRIHKALSKPTGMQTWTRPVYLYGVADIRPQVCVGAPQRGKKLNLQEVLREEEPISVPQPEAVQGWWHTSEERCAVCGLRPIGYLEGGLPSFVTSQKAREHRLCGVCLARRGRRAKEWATQPNSTIWLDEVADVNGRLALIVGRFSMDDWISGQLVRSMAVGTDKDGRWLAKPPTFARIHRVWRTTAEFWEQVNREMASMIRDDRRRIRFYLNAQPDLGEYHAYEMKLGPTSIDVVWVPPQEDHQGYLISVDNLEYVARLLGAPRELYSNPDTSAIFVEDFVKDRIPWKPVLRNPEAKATGRTLNLLSGFSIIRTDHQDVAYSTAIPILAEPRTFMALVPADRALDVVRAIRIRYEREMGKVRNRLPLHLGIVYADAHLPLRAVLDAGRRMLEQTASAYGWQVVNVREQPANGGTLPDRFQTDAQGQFARWREIDLEKDGCRLTWYVPAVMGDGDTSDDWYPYVFWQRDRDGKANPADANPQRRRYFEAPNPFNTDADGNPRTGWLVHAGELEEGDIVYFTPATLDYVWLGSSGERFEIAYNGNGRRCALPRRPYLLDDLDALDAIWRTLSSCLTMTQIHALNSLIESKRDEWQIDGDDDGVFKQFCRDVLVNAEWREEPWGNDRDKWLDDWSGYAVRGWIADVVELYHHVMKQQADPTSRRCEGETA